jgi:hypothetical protein
MTAFHQVATFSRSEHDHRCRKPTGSFRAAKRTDWKRPIADIRRIVHPACFQLWGTTDDVANGVALD